MYRVIGTLIVIAALGGVFIIANKNPIWLTAKKNATIAAEVTPCQEVLTSAMPFPSVNWDTNNIATSFNSIFAPINSTVKSSAQAGAAERPLSLLFSKESNITVGPLNSLAKLLAADSGGGTTACPTTGSPLINQVVTSYFPVKSYSASQGTEGGWATSRPGANGSYTPCTLELLRTARCGTLTIASDPSRYGQTFVIPEISFTNAAGGKYTLHNVPSLVHDTGRDFTGRPDKFDIAVDEATSDADAERLGRKQPSNSEIEFDPTGSCTGSGVTVTSEETGDNAAEGGSGVNLGGNAGGSNSTAFCGNGVWSSDPTCCYKHLGPAGVGTVIPGVLTCNSGFIWAGDPPVPVPVSDCGPLGKACDLSATAAGGGPLFACLFQACLAGGNAIWDPQTLKCGCDFGGGVAGGIASATGAAVGALTGGNEDDTFTDTTTGSAPAIDSDVMGDEAVNRDRLAADGIKINNGACTSPAQRLGCTDVGGLRENTLNGVEKFAAEYRAAYPGADVTVTAGNENSVHTSGITYSHADGYKTDLRYSPQLADYIKNTMKNDHGSVYYDTRGNRFYIENGGSGLHVDVQWTGKNS